MRLLPFLALPLLAGPAQAEVVSSSANAFHVRHTVPVVATADATFALLGQPALWWSPEHSYSGDAANFSMELRPGGCFCERLPGGGFVEHMRVIEVRPGEEIVLSGSLGPLRDAPASGTMRLKVETAGAASRINLDYKVTGFAAGDGISWATAVDQVLIEQLTRLRQRAASKGSRAVP